MSSDGVRVDRETMQLWAETALKVRAAAHAISDVATPLPGSSLNQVDDYYPSESASQWAREGLRSAVDHLLVWANHAIPLYQFEGQVVEHHGFRWSFTLARAAMEGAAESLWITSTPDVEVCAARLIRMIRHDLREQRLAWSTLGRNTDRIVSRAAKHAGEALKLAHLEPAAEKLPAMKDLVRLAAGVAGLDADRQEANWRTCSAAAHGRDWAVRELQTLSKPVEWRPGQFHMSGHPDPETLTRILDDAVTLLNVGVIRYLQMSGVDVDAVLKKSVVAAARETPQKDGGILVERMAAEYGL